MRGVDVLLIHGLFALFFFFFYGYDFCFGSKKLVCDWFECGEMYGFKTCKSLQPH